MVSRSLAVETVYDASCDGQPPLDSTVRRGGGVVGGFVPEVLEEDPGRVVRMHGGCRVCDAFSGVGHPSARSTNEPSESALRASDRPIKQPRLVGIIEISK